MKNLNKIMLHMSFLLVVSFTFFSCDEEPDTKFEVIESPVLAVFNGQSFAADDDIEVQAVFYELDKSGILDNAIGIDSTAIANLTVSLFINESDKITEVTTDNDGMALLSTTWDDLGGTAPVIRLEWVGSYNSQNFRIYYNISLSE